MKLLVTGFEPMRPMYEINPSWEAVKLLPEEIEGAVVVKACLPVAYGRADRLLEALLEREKPAALLCVGQSGNNRGLQVERVGVNLDDFRVADNDGNLRKDEPVVPGGPDAYFVNLPVRQMVEAIRGQGIPAELSYSAGTHLCNHVTYLARHLEATKFPGLRSGFVHVPLARSQCVENSRSFFMEPSVSAEGVRAALTAIVSALHSDGIF